MQHYPPVTLLPDTPAYSPRAADFLSSKDALALLQLMGALGPARHDTRAWRMELLAGINQLLPASASLAFILRQIDSNLQVISIVDNGFKAEDHRQAILREFNNAPFADPFSRLALEKFTAQRLDFLTCLRADLVDDQKWNADVHVLTHRRPSATNDSILSLARATERGAAYAILALRPAVSEPPPGTPAGANVVAASRFGPRERLLLDTLHRSLDWLYRIEESSQRVNRASGLPPRLRQTLEYLLAGDTERQVALKMSLSVHTVHDYVKSLYTHFGVSSRGELLAKWIGTGDKPAKGGPP